MNDVSFCFKNLFRRRFFREKIRSAQPQNMIDTCLVQTRRVKESLCQMGIYSVKCALYYLKHAWSLHSLIEIRIFSSYKRTRSEMIKTCLWGYASGRVSMAENEFLFEKSEALFEWNVLTVANIVLQNTAFVFESLTQIDNNPIWKYWILDFVSLYTNNVR